MKNLQKIDHIVFLWPKQTTTPQVIYLRVNNQHYWGMFLNDKKL